MGVVLGAALLVASPAPANPTAGRSVAAPAAGAQLQVVADPVTVPGSFTGYGFDSCTAPSQAEMDHWRTKSPYFAIGVYIGGTNRLCSQPELDARWMRTQVARGWHILPIQVGPQASCSGYDDRISPRLRTALGQGKSEARKAVSRAQALAIGKGSTLYYDLEDYDIGPDACRRSALSFLSGWTRGLHARGYASGVYSSLGAAITSLDYADRVSPRSYSMPDEIWFAWNNGRADTVTDERVQSSRWDQHDRVHQFVLDTTRSFGSVSLGIDINYLDVGRGSAAPPKRTTCGVDLDLGAYPVRSRGARGKAVAAAQCLLRQQRFGRVAVHGRFDAATVRAVKAAQRARELRVSGVMTRGTWTAMLSHGDRPVLKVGSVGEPARRVQRALTASLERRVPITGVMTKGTNDALERYQRRAGLEPSGVSDLATWRELQAGG